MAKAKKDVRYNVTGKVFFNGSLVDPKGGKDVFVTGPAGLEGRHLKVADDQSPATEDDGGGPAAGNGGNTVPPVDGSDGSTPPDAA